MGTMKWFSLDLLATVPNVLIDVCLLVLWPTLTLASLAVNGGNTRIIHELGKVLDSPSTGAVSKLQLPVHQQSIQHWLFDVSNSSKIRSGAPGSLNNEEGIATAEPVVETSSLSARYGSLIESADESRFSEIKAKMRVEVDPYTGDRIGKLPKGRPRHRRQCPSCHPPHDTASEKERQLADRARLESIKRQILTKLGLHAKPNVSAVLSRDFILETLLRAEESIDSETSSATNQELDVNTDSNIETTVDGSVEDDFFGKTSEIIAFAEQGPHLNGQVLVEFSRTHETEPSLRVKSATLWVYIKLRGPARNSYRQTHEKKPNLYVFRVASNQQPSLHNATQLDKNWNELLASQRVTIHHSGWKKINVTEGIQKWFSETDRNGNSNVKLRLLIDCSGCGASVEPILFSPPPDSMESSSKTNRPRRRVGQRTRETQFKRSKRSAASDVSQHRPFLVVHTDSTNSRRIRRRALDCSPTTRACCKQRFFVNFRALGWDDWIIAPSGYYANYCRGDCGGLNRTPDTFLNYHTHVLEEFRRIDSFPDLQPCCAPTKFSSMSLIYFGPDMNIIKRDLPKMVVDECGCP